MDPIIEASPLGENGKGVVGEVRGPLLRTPSPEKGVSIIFFGIIRGHGYVMPPPDTCCGPIAYHGDVIPGRRVTWELCLPNPLPSLCCQT